MKILFLSDVESRSIWEGTEPGYLNQFDLIISCGDLKEGYLSTVVTMAHCPVLYVCGNHDQSYVQTPPDGCDCIEDELVIIDGVRIAGLGGANRYKEGPFLYTPAEMNKRARKLSRKIKRAGGVDILVTHAAPLGVGDAEDFCHQGYKAFLELMDKFKPRYLVHGHQHQNYNATKFTRVRSYGDTKVINAYEKYILEI